MSSQLIRSFAILSPGLLRRYMPISLRALSTTPVEVPKSDKPDGVKPKSAGTHKVDGLEKRVGR